MIKECNAGNDNFPPFPRKAKISAKIQRCPPALLAKSSYVINVFIAGVYQLEDTSQTTYSVQY